MATTQNTIVHKRTAVANRVPTAGQLLFGEFALNYADGRVFIKTAANTILDITKSLYHIDGGLLVGTSSPLPAALAENDEPIYTEDFKRLTLG
jgi:hypothetical protein